MISKQENISLFKGLSLDGASLKAYFKRIGFEGKPEINLDTLKELHNLHPQAIPFENLDPLLGTPVELTLPAVFNKMVKEGRGGFCFEQNLLFGAVLNTIGFDGVGLSARVFWEIGEGEIRPRDHMLLLLDLEGMKYILDVGFGSASFSSPLVLQQEGIQDTGDYQYRISLVSGFYYLEIRIKNSWRLMHRFGLEAQMLPDYEVVSWFLCTSPKSVFIKDLMVARSFPDGRYALYNNQFTVHKKKEKSVKKTLHSIEELTGILQEIFLIKLPENVNLNAKFQGLITPVLTTEK
ncbi:arylamine N-acetyltransferase family protein [Cyclobacterium qasimii]|uniref:Arylamine N-acetyltransferase n=2 Tax=Cyclobacterium qasimii TaxID=1350429 RepID=S7X5V5_9BACT|nr:arylamine N-acetyltransferase [Cyclobacterium qasimii]EPR71463.1 arylamine N-acetyltransferase [Cyclobacterium qasimii M12-11B]GEO23648.1 N-hydroxyarylamine O-acetyltransferase [Cyclobacterium qasimii]